MKTEEILKLTLPEIDLLNCSPIARQVLEGVAYDCAPTEKPLTSEEFRKQTRGLKEAIEQSRERVKTTTVDDVLRGWSRKHESYLAINSRVFKHINLCVLSTFFRQLISLGLPEEYLKSLPSGQIVLDTKTMDEMFAA